MATPGDSILYYSWLHYVAIAAVQDCETLPVKGRAIMHQLST